MIKYLAFEYQSLFSFLNIFSYITFSAGASILTGLFFSLIFGNYIINKLSNVQPTGQPIRDDGPESHIIAKKGTPTMGGLLIILSVFVSTIIWADLQNIFIWILLSTILIFGSIGFADPDCRMSFGYVMNKMGVGLMLNQRGQSLVDAAYQSLGLSTTDSGYWE